MSTVTADFDTGEIRPPVGERTVNLAPFVRPDESGLNILRPAMPAAPLYRRRRGRHRREPSVLPVLLVLVGLWAVGCGTVLRLVGAW
jgi:hypothetical protein